MDSDGTECLELWLCVYEGHEQSLCSCASNITMSAITHNICKQTQEVAPPEDPTLCIVVDVKHRASSREITLLQVPLLSVSAKLGPFYRASVHKKSITVSAFC